MKLRLALAALTFIAATCAQADLAGTWRAHFNLTCVLRCTVNVPSNSASLANSSTWYTPGVASATPLTGKLQVGSDCRVVGSVFINNN